MPDTSIRWIVDDCVKFVEREIRRGNTYDAIIMDPPSYGRGPKGEIWKIEESVFPFIQLCTKVLSDKPLFFLINSYTTGLQPAVLSYMLSTQLLPRFGGQVRADEIGLPVTANRTCASLRSQRTLGSLMPEIMYMNCSHGYTSTTNTKSPGPDLVRLW